MSDQDRSRLDGRVAVITGSTKGIGRAVAEALLDQGARVTVSSRTPDDVAATVEELSEGAPDRVLGIVCDVRDPAACRALIEGTVDAFGSLDILVNNAGLGRFVPVAEMDDDVWDTQIRTNLDGVFYCSKAAAPHLAARGRVRNDAWIFNIGSLAGRYASAGGVAYNASKFGLIGMTEAMMLDLRHQGIRVSVLMPGTVNTHFFEGGPDPDSDWKLQSEDVAQVITDLLAHPSRAHVSRIEIRPSQPPRKD